MEQLLHMPTELLRCMDYQAEGLLEDMHCYGEPTGPNSLTYMIYVKLFSLYLHMVFKEKNKEIPVFLVNTENLWDITSQDISQYDMLNSSYMYALYDNYFMYCIETLNKLVLYGWSETNHFVINSENIDTIFNTKKDLYSIYEDYFEQMIENIQPKRSDSYEIYVYQDRRLGVFENYCLSHEVDEQLKNSIQDYLGAIENVIGADNCVYSNREDCHEVLYIIDHCERDSIALDFDILLPVYAYNLEVLLDKAYSIYPLKEEELKCRKKHLD